MFDQYNFLYEQIKTLKTENALLRNEKEAIKYKMKKANDEENLFTNLPNFGWPLQNQLRFPTEFLQHQYSLRLPATFKPPIFKYNALGQNQGSLENFHQPSVPENLLL